MIVIYANPGAASTDLQRMPAGILDLALIRALEAESGRQIPALALTAYVRVEDRARALSAGFNMFVPKPVEPSELITAIANLSDAGGGEFARE